MSRHTHGRCYSLILTISTPFLKNSDFSGATVLHSPGFANEDTTDNNDLPLHPCDTAVASDMFLSSHNRIVFGNSSRRNCSSHRHHDGKPYHRHAHESVASVDSTTMSFLLESFTQSQLQINPQTPRITYLFHSHPPSNKIQTTTLHHTHNLTLFRNNGRLRDHHHYPP